MEIYNIALLPASISNQVIEYSHFLSAIADKYLLGKNSRPHVTLCQFLAQRDEAMDTWKQVCSALQNRSIHLRFEAFSCLSFDNQLFWVSLLPTHNKALIDMHWKVASFAKKPVSRIRDQYDPHMTLINTRQPEYKSQVKKLEEIYTPISDLFSIALGKSDLSGQFIELVAQHEKDGSLMP